MAKHVLHNTGDELDFELVGLSTPRDRYSMILALNEALSVDFNLEEELHFYLKDGKLFYFSLYTFFSDDFNIEYSFISNHSNLEPGGGETTSNDLFAETQVEESVRLIKELPKTDYFLILKGEDLHLYKHKIIELLKKIEDVVQVQNIEPETLPSRTNLLF
jgi:hypothetical protein